MHSSGSLAPLATASPPPPVFPPPPASPAPPDLDWQLRLGVPSSLHTSFTYDAGADFLKNDIRVKPDLDAHGALGDAGWYCIRASLWAADYDLPKTLTALREPDFNEAGVILSCGASLRWEDGRVATFYCSFLTNLSMDITALGTKGYLRVHDFVVPFQENVGPFFVASNSKFGERALGCEPIPVEHIVTTDLPQEALMVTEFATLVNGIKSKGLKPEKKWPTLSRKTQLVLVQSIEHHPMQLHGVLSGFKC
ncbi:uncharacterized oxidoreductase At4g09670-like [Cornus florida]|uniref:uncharacterized oxidoreductase At4g09670-like n=1 Tax=Cornus florida TaxID=4283 RepID=UPI002897EBFC|nr:uncharacterized oxidoreductase At4g09670-like [Cornus florida]